MIQTSADNTDNNAYNITENTADLVHWNP